MIETTRNAFLGGRIEVEQPKNGYRAGADPVLLAAAVDAKPGQDVLDLGCGVGVASLCLMARVPDLRVTGIELQPGLADLARGNLSANGLSATIVTCDATALPGDIRGRVFDHVMTNPPFFDQATGSASKNVSRELGRRAGVSLLDWLDIALKRLRPGGTVTLVNRVERLPECLTSLADRTGDIRLLPLAARRGRPAKLFLLSARKGAKAPMTLLAPFVLHDGEAHQRDEDSYSREARTVLRDGCPIRL